MNDAQLVEACLEGDHRAYALLVDRYRYPVFGLCLSYVKDFDAAEDAAQEALIAAYLKLESLPAPQKFGPVAAGPSPPISAGCGLRRQRRQVAIDEDMAVVDPAPSPAEQVLSCERRPAGCGRCFPTEPAATTGRGPFLSRGPLTQADRRLSRRRGIYRRAAALPGAPQPKRGDDNHGQGKPARTPPARGLHTGSSTRGAGPGTAPVAGPPVARKPAKPLTASSPPCRTTSKPTEV